MMAGVVVEVGRATRLGTTIKAILQEAFGAINFSGSLPRATADGMDTESVPGMLLGRFISSSSRLCPTD